MKVHPGLATEGLQRPGLLTRASGAVKGYLFGYDAVEEKGRRKSTPPQNRTEDRELTPTQRYRLVATTRDIQRNFSIAAWAIRKHLDYVSTFRFQARTGNKALDQEIERLMRWRSRKQNCDYSKRHPLPRLVRMWEERRTIDGDILINRLADGRIQSIEGDRIRNPIGMMPPEVKPENVVHGVEINPASGETLRYLISDRKPNTDTLAFSGTVNGRFADLLAYYTRLDQVRGVAPLAPAVNTLRDTYENFDYALAKAKVAQLFALVFTRQADDGEPITSVSESAESTDENPRYEVDLGRGPQILEMDPGDDAEFLESNQPSDQFQSFTTTMIGVALKALDIPLSFYDEGQANFSSGRQAWILYEQSATSKRNDLRDVLDNCTAFWLAGWILDESLILPGGMLLRDIRWEWVHAGIPWMDPLKEITADIAAVRNGMDSRTRQLKERGLDYEEIIDELAAEEKYAAEKGVSLSTDTIDLAAAARNAQGDQTNSAQGKK